MPYVHIVTPIAVVAIPAKVFARITRHVVTLSSGKHYLSRLDMVSAVVQLPGSFIVR